MTHNIKVTIEADDLPGGRDIALAMREFFQRRGWSYTVRDGGPQVFGMVCAGAPISADVATKFTADAMKRAGAFEVVIAGPAGADRTIQATVRAMDLVLDSPAYPEKRGELLEFLVSAMSAVASDHAAGRSSGDGGVADALLIGLDAIVAMDPSRRPLLERFLATALEEEREHGGADEIAPADQDDGDSGGEG